MQWNCNMNASKKPFALWNTVGNPACKHDRTYRRGSWWDGSVYFNLLSKICSSWDEPKPRKECFWGVSDSLWTTSLSLILLQQWQLQTALERQWNPCQTVTIGQIRLFLRLCIDHQKYWAKHISITGYNPALHWVSLLGMVQVLPLRGKKYTLLASASRFQPSTWSGDLQFLRRNIWPMQIQKITVHCMS